jgi:signal peptidase I
VKAPSLRGALRTTARVVECALAITGLCFLVYHGFFQIERMTTGSMAPLLRGASAGEPDWILIEKRLNAGVIPVDRFSVVSFLDEEGTSISKRAVAFSGETVAIQSRTLLIDGKPVTQPPGIGGGRGSYLAAGNLYDGKTYRVPEGRVYLLGDDTQDSSDSRFIGALPVSRVRGRVIMRIWPPQRLELLLGSMEGR